MTVVIDASAIIKLLLPDEVGSRAVDELWDADIALIAPVVLLPEVTGALRAAMAAGRLPATLDPLADALDLARNVRLRTVNEALALRAGELAARHGLRGMDSLYLATATEYVHHDHVALLSFDRRQRSGALELGIAVIPAEVD